MQNGNRRARHSQWDTRVNQIDVKRLGEHEIAPNRRNRILVLEHKGRLSGLIVDSASEVIKIPAADVEPSPTEFLEGKLNCVTGLGKYQGRLIVLLDMAKLLEFGGSEPKEKTPQSGRTAGAPERSRSATASK